MSNTRKLLSAVGALLFFTILFCLPASAFPKEDWLSKIWFDKWVHIGIFMILNFLWARAFYITRFSLFVVLVTAALAYGLTIEIIQDRLISNRSFDLGDLLADLVGSLIGVLLWKRYIKK